MQTHADKANLTTGNDWATTDDIDGELSPGDTCIAELGRPIYTTCCPTGTTDFLSEKNYDDEDVYEGCCNAVSATLSALTTGLSRHPLKFLILSGSLRSESYSRRLAVEVGRILASYGAQVKLFDPKGLPLFSQDIDPKSDPKVKELRNLTRWCEGMVWISPEVHGNYSAVFKNQVDWMPLTEGAIRPTQGKTLAVMQVEAGSQSFNTVNNLRVLGRWMRMVVVPNQASIPRAYEEFNEDGTMKDGPHRGRVLDVVDEIFKFTLLLRDQQQYLTQRYSEKKAEAERHLQETAKVADKSVLRSLNSPIIIDVRSEKEVTLCKGGEAIKGSIQVPLNVNNEPQSTHQTTAEEFREKLKQAGVDLRVLPKGETSFITHCTSGHTSYIGRGNRAAALLRDMGFEKAYNGGSPDEIRAAIGEEASVEYQKTDAYSDPTFWSQTGF